jgi:hypothetical protein
MTPHPVSFRPAGHGPWAFLRSALAVAVLVSGLVGLVSSEEVDYGVYTVSVKGTAVGVEDFVFDVYRDTILITSASRTLVQTPDGPDSLKKAVSIMLSTFDMGLLSYQSNEEVAGNLRTRGLIMADTQYTAFWEYNKVGDAMVFDRPPGRLYVHDPGVYVLFDLIARDLNEKQFTTRPIQLMVLGRRDTTVEAQVTRLPPERIRWGHKPVEARKFSINDGRNELLIWLDQQGRMLRLEQAASGLRVERKPPPIKGRAAGG